MRLAPNASGRTAEVHHHLDGRAKCLVSRCYSLEPPLPQGYSRSLLVSGSGLVTLRWLTRFINYNGLAV